MQAFWGTVLWKGDHKGVRDAFRFKIVACGFLAIIWMLILGFANEPLIRLFCMKEEAREILKLHYCMQNSIYRR